MSFYTCPSFGVTVAISFQPCCDRLLHFSVQSDLLPDIGCPLRVLLPVPLLPSMCPRVVLHADFSCWCKYSFSHLVIYVDYLLYLVAPSPTVVSIVSFCDVIHPIVWCLTILMIPIVWKSSSNVARIPSQKFIILYVGPKIVLLFLCHPRPQSSIGLIFCCGLFSVVPSSRRGCW